jgi:hypothetical protein
LSAPTTFYTSYIPRPSNWYVAGSSNEQFSFVFRGVKYATRMLINLFLGLAQRSHSQP